MAGDRQNAVAYFAAATQVNPEDGEARDALAFAQQELAAA
jgi:hypothetical protein